MRRIALAVAVTWAPLPRAQATPPTAQEEAERHDRAGRQAFAEGRYEDCVASYRAAQAAVPSERYAFNIGKCSERGGRIKDAIDGYEDYLRLLPQAPDRAAVELQLRVLRETDRESRGVRLVRIATQPAADVGVRDAGGSWRTLGTSPLEVELPVGTHTLRATRAGYVAKESAVVIAEHGQAIIEVLEPFPEPEPAPEPAPEPVVQTDGPTLPGPQSGDLAAAGWATAGVGLAVLATGVALGALADQRAEEANGLLPRDHTRSEHERLAGEADTFATVANVGYAVGGGALAVGVALLIADAVDAPAVSAAPIPGGALATAAWSF